MTDALDQVESGVASGGSPAPDPDPVGSMLAVLDLSSTGARTSEDIFTGGSQQMPGGRVFGGQVLAQSLIAAARTLPETRSAHSMHGYFLRPGDSSRDITFAVDRIHDGRSFSTRRTQAFQAGVPIFSMIASFQDDDPGLEHQSSMPEGLPAPEDLADVDQATGDLHPATKRLFVDRPIDLRHIPSPLYFAVEGEPAPAQAVWMRTRRSLPDDLAAHSAADSAADSTARSGLQPILHSAVLAYASDMTIQESILRAHGVAWATPGLKVASLDHAIWWHRPGRVDEWLLYVQESPNARGGRGLSTGRIFSRDGRLLASVAQEITIRVPSEE